MFRLKSLGALAVAPLTCLSVLACDTGQEESSLTAPSPSFTVAGNPVVASASGAGHFIAGSRRTFSFTAQRHYDGTVKGRFQVNRRDLGTRVQGTVTCITVEGDGKTARIGGIVTSSSNPARIGLDAVFTVVDNSEGPQSPADQTTFVALTSPSTVAFHCATGIDPGAFGGLFDILSGNIQVDQQGGPCLG